MHHYVNAITNTKGDALIGYFVRCVDAATGAAATLYADVSLTPILSVSGVANAAQVDSDGNVSFYITAGSYHLDIYATDSTSFVRRIQNLPMIEDVGATVTVTPIAYGAAGDGTTDDYAAFAAAIAALPDRGGSLYVPRGYYRLSQKLTITKQVRIYGEGWSQNPGTVGATSYTGFNLYTGSVIVCDADVGGIEFVAYTDNASNALAFEFQSSTGSIAKDIMLYSLGGTGTTAHGIENYVVLNLDNVRVEGFAGVGVKTFGDGSATANQYGNTALSSYRSVSVRFCKLHGFHTSGGNTSVVHFLGCDSASNGGVAFLDATPFGNLYLACHTATNNASYGTPAGYSAAQRTKNTTDWAGLSDQLAGSFVSTAAQGFTPFIGCYVEFDTGYKAELSAAAIIIGGLLATDSAHTTSSVGARQNKGIFKNVSKFYADTSGSFEVAKGYLDITEDQGYVAPSAGGRLQFNGTLGLTICGVGGTYDLGLRSTAGSVMLVPHNTLNSNFQGNIDVASGKVYSVNSTQVVGARGAAVADATGAGDVVAQLNALLARCRAHGLIAP